MCSSVFSQLLARVLFTDINFCTPPTSPVTGHHSSSVPPVSANAHHKPRCSYDEAMKHTDLTWEWNAGEMASNRDKIEGTDSKRFLQKVAMQGSPPVPKHIGFPVQVSSPSRGPGVSTMSGGREAPSVIASSPVHVQVGFHPPVSMTNPPEATTVSSLPGSRDVVDHVITSPPTASTPSKIQSPTLSSGKCESMEEVDERMKDYAPVNRQSITEIGLRGSPEMDSAAGSFCLDLSSLTRLSSYPPSGGTCSSEGVRENGRSGESLLGSNERAGCDKETPRSLSFELKNVSS